MRKSLTVLLLTAAVLSLRIGAAAEINTYCGQFAVWYAGPAGSPIELIIDDWNPDAPNGGSFKVTDWYWNTPTKRYGESTWQRKPNSETVSSNANGVEARAVIYPFDRDLPDKSTRYTVRILGGDDNSATASPIYRNKGDAIYEACDRFNCTAWRSMGNMFNVGAEGQGRCPKPVVVGPLPTPTKNLPIVRPVVRPDTPSCHGCQPMTTETGGLGQSRPGGPNVRTDGMKTCWDGKIISTGSLCPPEPSRNPVPPATH